MIGKNLDRQRRYLGKERFRQICFSAKKIDRQMLELDYTNIFLEKFIRKKHSRGEAEIRKIREFFF